MSRRDLRPVPADAAPGEVEGAALVMERSDVVFIGLAFVVIIAVLRKVRVSCPYGFEALNRPVTA